MPPTPELAFVRENRARIEALIEWLIAQLDRVDGDPDAEPDDDGEEEPDECSGAQPVSGVVPI